MKSNFYWGIKSNQYFEVVGKFCFCLEYGLSYGVETDWTELKAQYSTLPSTSSPDPSVPSQDV